MAFPVDAIVIYWITFNSLPKSLPPPTIPLVEEPPYFLAEIENEIFDNRNILSREEVIENLIPYIKDETKKGTRLNQIMRHTLGLFHGQTGSSYWKRYLSENMCVRDADVQKINHIMDRIKYNNVETRVG